MAESKISTLVFDLGGVIVDLDVSRTFRALAQIAGISEEKMMASYLEQELFKDYETGKIDSIAFRAELRKLLNNATISDTEIDKAWNAMIVDLPIEKLNLMESLKRDYQVLILSNTNDIHIDYIHKDWLPGLTQHETLSAFVHHAYYSHEINLRKPDTEIYKFVLESHNLAPGEVVFLDDTVANIESAKQIGIRTHLISHPDHVYDALKEYGGYYSKG